MEYIYINEFMKNVIIVPSQDNMYFCGIADAEFRKYSYDSDKAMKFTTFQDAQDEAKRLNEISSHTFEAIQIL
jgi:hypothetical protein